jgi:hypothetical protein
MWSLPDIQRLNSEAHLNRKKLERAVLTGVLDGERLGCEHGDNCVGPLTHELWFDVFSNDPKGIVTQCEYHLEHYGTPAGFFWCEKCCRLMIENYTWELYRTASEDGEQLCLCAAAEQLIDNEDNWIALTDEDIAVVTFEVIRQARHVVGVGTPVPKKIQLFDSITIDSSTGGAVRGFSSADPTPNGAVEQLQEILNQAKRAGYERAILIIDGGFQFAVSVGVYTRAKANAGQDDISRGRKEARG